MFTLALVVLAACVPPPLPPTADPGAQATIQVLTASLARAEATSQSLVAVATAPAAPTFTPEPAPPTETEAPATAGPSATRTPRPLTASAAAPCQIGEIKGNRNSKIFHVPTGGSYAQTKANVQCFPTESAAQAAGYRKAAN